MNYTLIRGTFHVDGYQTDGDSLRFEADSLSDWQRNTCMTKKGDSLWLHIMIGGLTI